jgi:peptidoglycan pentaglycine glycine transferase (the first glycine)
MPRETSTEEVGWPSFEVEPRTLRETVSISEAPDDPRWDAFLSELDRAHHTQSAAWGRIKAVDGWTPLRVVVEREGHIVAGAQLLHRGVSALGRVGYLAHGPVSRPGHAVATECAMLALRDVARHLRIRAVLIEPDPHSTSTLHLAAVPHLVPTQQRSSLGATVVVDVARTPTAILAGMRSKTRYNVRLAEQRGICVRLGDVDDLPTFHRLLVATAARQGFSAGSQGRYARWFDELDRGGHLRLFLAEHEGEPVSAMLAIAFGDTVVYKRGAWSGQHGERRPNEALHWGVIQWAHEAGFRWYDLDGIDRSPAERVLRGEPVPADYLNSVTRFKLGFGGDITLLPQPRLLLPGATARWAHARFGDRIGGSKRARSVILRS